MFIVNTETEVVWLWDAQSDFPIEEGGSYPRDWSHINVFDAEYSESGEMEGRIMVSFRNQDQVVFLDRQEGLLGNWTLGTENEYNTQYEQHNPDYIPESEGGPSSSPTPRTAAFRNSSAGTASGTVPGSGRTTVSSGLATPIGSPMGTRSSLTPTATA